MKKKTYLITLLTVLVCTSAVFATEIWSWAGGNWTTASSWAYWNGSSWVNAWVPTASDHVVLCNTSSSTPMTLASVNTANIDHLYMGNGGSGDTDQLEIYGTLDLNNAGGPEYNTLYFGNWNGPYDADSEINVYSGGWFDVGDIYVINSHASAVHKINNYGGVIAWVNNITLNSSKLIFKLYGGETDITASSISGASSSNLNIKLNDTSAILTLDPTLLTSLINAGCIIADGTTVNSSNRSTLLDEDTSNPYWTIISLVAGSAPGQASSPSPANSATGVSTNVNLTWTAGSNANSHDVYFGTDSTPDSGEYQGNQTTASFAPGILNAGTTYYWRIDEINAYGTTTGTVWSFTTGSLPGATSNPSPSHSATGVSVTSDLSWTAGSGATSYNLYGGTTNPPPFSKNQTGTTWDVGTLAYNTTYYWRIDSVNAIGTTSGTVWSFTTETAPSLPDKATNPTPADDANDVSISLGYYSWDTASGATSYKLYSGTSFPLTYRTTTSNTTVSWGGNGAYSTTYYWRVDTVNANGTTTGDVWNFTTEAAPGYPDKVTNPTPADQATEVSVSLGAYSWSAADGATSYKIYSGQVNPPGYWQTTTNTSVSWGGNANYNTTYYWRVDAVNASGTTVGDVWTFTTEASGGSLPGPVSQPAPPSGEKHIWKDVDLSWTEAENAASYNVYFGTDSTPDSGEYKGNVTDPGYTLGTLAENTWYYWRIDPVNSNGTTTGTVYSFKTESGTRLTPEQFPIAAWDINQSSDKYTRPSMDTMRACGFNVAGLVKVKNLDNIAASGMKTFMLDYNNPYGSTMPLTEAEANRSQSEINNIVNYMVNNYGSHPANFGYVVRDEPPTSWLPGLGNWVDAYRTADPYHKAYISLGWDYDWSSLLTYVDNDFLSYDWYGIRTENGTDFVEPYYFPILEKAYAASSSSGLPLWNMGNSIKQYDPETAMPALANLRFQAFSSLAYGVKGIFWFTYFSDNTISPAPIHMGSKTSFWYDLQAVNQAVHKIGPTYLTLTNGNVFHYPNVPAGQPYMNYPSRGISTSWYVSAISGGDYVVGEFYNASSTPYLMVTNKSLYNTATVYITLKSPYSGASLYYVNDSTGQLQAFSQGQALAPGNGLLIKVQ